MAKLNFTKKIKNNFSKSQDVITISDATTGETSEVEINKIIDSLVSTSQEVIDGVNNNTIVTPVKLKEALNNKAPLLITNNDNLNQAGNLSLIEDLNNPVKNLNIIQEKKEVRIDADTTFDNTLTLNASITCVDGVNTVILPKVEDLLLTVRSGTPELVTGQYSITNFTGQGVRIETQNPDEIWAVGETRYDIEPKESVILGIIFNETSTFADKKGYKVLAHRRNLQVITTDNSKQDKTSTTTISKIAGATTTSQKIRTTDQTINSDLDFDTFFANIPEKNATGQVIIPSLNAIANSGDTKFSSKTADHGDWILLNGRLKSSLTVSQQVVANALGYGVNIPDMRGKFPLGANATYPLNSSGGSLTIAQANLPVVDLVSSTQAAHTHSYQSGAGSTAGLASGTFVAGEIGSQIQNKTTGSAGSHSHTSPLNPVAGGQTNYIQPYQSGNWFVWLGGESPTVAQTFPLSLTTTGTGVATLSSGVLNIPTIANTTVAENANGAINITDTTGNQAQAIRQVSELVTKTTSPDGALDMIPILEASTGNILKISKNTLVQNEVLYNNGALSGIVPAGKELGIDTATGTFYYKNASGNWQEQPVGTTVNIIDNADGTLTINAGLGGTQLAIRPINELASATPTTATQLATASGTWATLTAGGAGVNEIVIYNIICSTGSYKVTISNWTDTIIHLSVTKLT